MARALGFALLWVPALLGMTVSGILWPWRVGYGLLGLVATFTWMVTWPLLRARWLERPVVLTVGADGMFVVGGAGSGFTSWSEIENLILAPDVRGAQSAPALYLVRTGGERVRLGALAGSAADARSLVKHARGLRAAYASNNAVAAATSLARDGRDAARWLSGVRSMRVESSDYRSASVDDEILWSVVEDPRAELTARAGAAAALVTERDPRAQARLRVAVESSASPALRETLDAISSAEAEDDVTRALHRLR